MSKKLSTSILFVILILISAFALTACISTSASASAKQLELGNKYLLELKYEEAIIAFNKVIEIDPKNIPARIGLGKAYIAAGQPDKAESVLKEALDIDPKSSDAYIDLAALYYEQDKIDDAIKLLEKGYEQTQDDNIKKLWDQLREEQANEQRDPTESETVNAEQPSSQKQEVTDENILAATSEYIDSFSTLPPFSDIASIDKAWVVRKYIKEVVSYNDEMLFSKYSIDYFTRPSEIEKAAQNHLNPSITVNSRDDFSSFDGTYGSTIHSPLWLTEEKVFGWGASGGYSYESHVNPLETYEIGGNYYIKAIDLLLSFDQDYFDGQPFGKVYSLTVDNPNPDEYVEIGTFTMDEETKAVHYEFTLDMSKCVEYWYVIEPRSSGGFTLIAKQHAAGPEPLEIPQVASATDKKSEYLQKLNNIEIGLEELDYLYNGPTYQMVQAAKETHQRWDDALNEIYGVLKMQLTADEMSKLQEEQRKWIASRDTAAEAAAAEFEGGSLAPLEYAGTLAQVTKERCYELVEVYVN
jgi:uncharacterized protein YecT (DUF1311 family)